MECANDTVEKYVPIEREDEDIWINLAIKGDKVAFAHLYDRYYHQVHAFCMRMLHGRADVDDAVQQVFLEGWRSLYRFERRSLFSTWLTKIAIHTCLSFHRKNSRLLLSNDEKETFGDDAQEVAWSKPTPIPDEQLWMSARRNAIEKILSKMTKKKQQVFMMSDMEGMTAPEISQILGIPDATVRTRLFHARKEFINSVHRNPVYRDLFQDVSSGKEESKKAA